ncbi:MAG: hypothetical protein ACOCXM_02740 [Myxococcota bacterium]
MTIVLQQLAANGGIDMRLVGVIQRALRLGKAEAEWRQIRAPLRLPAAR